MVSKKVASRGDEKTPARKSAKRKSRKAATREIWTPDKFYIGIAKDGDQVLGHVTSVGRPSTFDRSERSSSLGEADEKVASRAKVDQTETETDAFEAVFRSFVASMETYRQFISLSLSLVSRMSNTIAEKEIEIFVKKYGVLRAEDSNESTTIYELPMSRFRDYRVIETRIESAQRGAVHLPEVMIIGLVSIYDAFLTKMIRAYLDKHGGVVLSTEKSIPYSQLVGFKTIDDARSAILDDVVEDVLRNSHQQQIDWLESKIKVDLKKDLRVWPDFIELCERRNLMTHTGGVVSSQYLQVCRSHKANCNGVKLGDKLSVDPDYFARSVAIVYEMGVRICSTLWRKYNKSASDDVDSALNELGFDLINDRAYNIAETVLSFVASIPKHKIKERTRRMIIVNLANAVRLQKRMSEACEILDKEDWSASDEEFLICVAAVRGDVTAVVKLMGELRIQNKFPAEQYRNWPIFRGLHSNPKFMQAFETAYGEPLNLPVSTNIGREVTKH